MRLQLAMACQSASQTPARRVAVQHYMSLSFDLRAAQIALDQVGEHMGVCFDLRPDAGDILLLDSAMQARLSPQMIHALREDRPLVTLPGQLGPDAASPRNAQHSRGVVNELLHQCRAITLVGERRQADAGFEPCLPRLLQRVLQGRQVRDTPPLLACYGPGACMHMDFGRALVVCDPVALQHLRLHRVLPQQVAQATLQGNAVRRGLDEALWDLGIAAAACPLHNAPNQCWTAPIMAAPGTSIRKLSLRPLHVDALRLLQAGPLAPAELRRRLRAGETELRGLLQACLFLGLAHWVKPNLNPKPNLQRLAGAT